MDWSQICIDLAFGHQVFMTLFSRSQGREMGHIVAFVVGGCLFSLKTRLVNPYSASIFCTENVLC